MGIAKPVVAEIAKGVYCINEFGMDSLFLVTGEERALLVDTGCGLADLPALVKSLTDLPYDVALTHGHVDHAGGIFWFDRVYLNEKDYDMARSRTTREAREGYINATRPVCEGVWDVGGVITPDAMPEFWPLNGGDCFDLGGRKVSVYETPGHTPGGLSFLIEDERILLSGDACNNNTLLFGADGRADLEKLLETAKKIEAMKPRYDRNYNGHIGYGDEIAFFPMAERLTRDMIGMVERILAGEDCWEVREGFMGRKVAIAECDTCRVQFNPF